MKVYQLMAELACKPAGEEVVLYCYGDACSEGIAVVDYDNLGRVAISSSKELFEKYDKKYFSEELVSDGE